MSRFESEVWNLLVGVLAGMVLQFWFWWDIDFFRVQWPAMMAVLTGWFVVRDVIWRRKHGRHSNVQR